MKTIFISSLFFFSISSLNAQIVDSISTLKDTTVFKAGGKLWGLAYGDYYYKSHADSLNRGSYQYSKVAKNTNAFQFRRIYLGYTYEINPKFTAELLLSAEDDFTTSTGGINTGTAGDVLVDNRFSPYIKYANVRWKNIWKGTDLIAGLQPTPVAAIMSEPAWYFRPIERTAADFNKSNTSDFGVGLQGKFDPETETFGYDILIANGTKSAPETDNYKWFYGDIWAKFLDKKLWFDLYADYNKLGYTGSGNANPHSRNMYKVDIAYVTDQFSFGIQGFINKNNNDVVGVNKNTLDTAAQDASGSCISAYIRGQIIKNKLGFFARYDNFNPDTNYGNDGVTNYITNSYTSSGISNAVSPVYDVNTKTEFITAGLDFTPAKNVHFMPNFWYVRYSGQQDNLNGAAAHDYDLVLRMTFYFTFGK